MTLGGQPILPIVGKLRQGAKSFLRFSQGFLGLLALEEFQLEVINGIS
jgi:hypothetical protein